MLCRPRDLALVCRSFAAAVRTTTRALRLDLVGTEDGNGQALRDAPTCGS